MGGGRLRDKFLVCENMEYVYGLMNKRRKVRLKDKEEGYHHSQLRLL